MRRRELSDPNRRLIIPVESAHRTISCLGELGLLALPLSSRSLLQTHRLLSLSLAFSSSRSLHDFDLYFSSDPDFPIAHFVSVHQDGTTSPLTTRTTSFSPSTRKESRTTATTTSFRSHLSHPSCHQRSRARAMSRSFRFSETSDNLTSSTSQRSKTNPPSASKPTSPPFGKPPS